MTVGAREQILDGMRAALKRGPLDSARRAELEARLAAPARNVEPGRAKLDPAARVDLFVRMAEEVQATVARVARPEDVPEAVADYLKSQNLPPRLKMAPDPGLDALPWDRTPLLEIGRGRAEDRDAVSLTGAFAAVAETGTLFMVSGPEHPTTLNFMPDTHVAVVRASRVVATYEDAWDRLRRAGKDLPRTVNMITGPSRTGDIEQTIQLGAHGPRRLHVVLIDDGAS